jgi:hypothetical protein
MRRSALLFLSVALFGCGAPAHPLTSDVSGKADGVDNTGAVTFTLLQAGAIPHTWDGDTMPDLVHYGVMGQPGPDWQDVADAPIQYDANNTSLPVQVTLTNVSARPILGFVLHTKIHTGEDIWTENQYVDLRHPEGTLVTLPLSDGAPYPFQCYEVGVSNAGAANATYYDGKITDIYYGFTLADTATYQANNDVAWLDLFDHAMAAGDVTPIIRHDGDYKGSYRMLPVRIRVPQNRNLVFKLAMDKFVDTCTSSGLGATQHVETQTYFVPVK